MLFGHRGDLSPAAAADQPWFVTHRGIALCCAASWVLESPGGGMRCFFWPRACITVMLQIFSKPKSFRGSSAPVECISPSLCSTPLPWGRTTGKGKGGMLSVHGLPCPGHLEPVYLLLQRFLGSLARPGGLQGKVYCSCLAETTVSPAHVGQDIPAGIS